MRGTRLLPLTMAVFFGIIPAYAGNTLTILGMNRYQGDHPRVCGEHQGLRGARISALGSSPRMRGTPAFAPDSFHRIGIIPAYAGNTKSTSPTCRPTKDHPRVCGEHFRAAANAFKTGGSSPRMRGTREDSQSLRSADGIIPAYAGNTSSAAFSSAAFRDHPRVCGEHPYRIIPIPEDMGSSPRMRGTHVANSYHGISGGIIPAYAGNTLF